MTMNIQLKKAKDGRSTLACVRPDGSRTWAKLHPFFPVHDLTHCAVETVFGFRSAFFGLVASGWPLDGFGSPDGRRDLPAEALWAECIVGLLDRERAMDEAWSAAALSEALSASLRGIEAAPFRPVTDEELARVRALRDELAARWRALPRGETLEVPFPASVVPA
jgi:hypothetical protein